MSREDEAGKCRILCGEAVALRLCLAKGRLARKRAMGNTALI